MPDEVKHAADAKAPVPSTPSPSPAPAPKAENKAEAKAETKPENKAPLIEKLPDPPPAAPALTAMSPEIKEVSKVAKPGEVVPVAAWDIPTIAANDLADLLAFKGIISREDIAALADPAIGGTTVHRVDRLRYRFDPEFAGDVAKARQARLKRNDLINASSPSGGPPKLNRDDEDLGDLKAALPAAMYRPGAS